MLRSARKYDNSIFGFSKRSTYSTEHQPQLFTFWSTVNKDSLTMFVSICFLDDDLSFWSKIESHGSFCINCPGVLDVE